MKDSIFSYAYAVIIFAILFWSPLQSRAEEKEFLLAEGTPVNIIVNNPIRSDSQGPFAGEVAADIYSKDMSAVLIPKGSEVKFQVNTEKNGRAGKAGVINILSATVSDLNGETILLAIPGYQIKGANKKDLAWGLSAGTFLFTGPFGFLFLLIKGKNAEIPAGTLITEAYVSGSHKIIVE